MKYILIFILSILIFSCESKRDPFAEYTKFNKTKIFGERIWLETRVYDKNIETELWDSTNVPVIPFSNVINDSTQSGGYIDKYKRKVINLDTVKISFKKDTMYTKYSQFILRTSKDTILLIEKIDSINRIIIHKSLKSKNPVIYDLDAIKSSIENVEFMEKKGD